MAQSPNVGSGVLCSSGVRGHQYRFRLTIDSAATKRRVGSYPVGYVEYVYQPVYPALSSHVPSPMDGCGRQAAWCVQLVTFLYLNYQYRRNSAYWQADPTLGANSHHVAPAAPLVILLLQLVLLSLPSLYQE